MIGPIVSKMKGLFLKPVETFQQSANDGLGVAFTYFAVLLLLNAILSALFAFAGFGESKMFAEIMGGIAVPIAVFFVTMVAGFILTLILVAWIHLLVYLFHGHKGIMQTFKAITYGNTPLLLLGWIPFIGIIFALWSLVLGIMGIRELQEISTGKAILVYIFAIIIPLICVILLIAYLMTSNMVFLPVPVLPGD